MPVPEPATHRPALSTLGVEAGDEGTGEKQTSKGRGACTTTAVVHVLEIDRFLL